MENNKQKLQEQLLAEFDAVDKFGKFVGRAVGSGAKSLGAVAGGVAGLGSAIKKGYQAGKQTVGGGGANVNTKQQPKQQVNQQPKQPGKFGQTMKNLARDVGGVAKDTAAGKGYDYTVGTRSQNDPKPTVGTAGQQAQTQAAGNKQAPAKRQKTGGKVAGQTSQTASAQYQRDRRAAKKAGSSAVSQGISQAQKDAANQGVANMQKQQAGKTATRVPGQKAPGQTAPSKTAQNVSKKTGVTTAKMGGQKIDLTDPRMKNLRAAIEKAAPGVIAGVDKLQPADKAKLKKAIA